MSEKRMYEEVFSLGILESAKKGFLVLIYPAGNSVYSSTENHMASFPAGEVHVSVHP